MTTAVEYEGNFSVHGVVAEFWTERLSLSLYRESQERQEIHRHVK